jgi:carbon-monoxide dehydrogenase medium subunit
VKLVGPQGERIVPLESFFTGPMRTVLERGEIMAEIRVPRLPSGSGGAFTKHSVRRAMDLAIVSASAVVILDSSKGTCSDVRIAMGVAGPTPARARRAESLARGRKPDSRLAEEVGIAAAEEAKPRSSFRASAEYRREVLKVLVKRVFSKAAQRAMASSVALGGSI